MSNNNLNLSIVPYGPAELPDRTVCGIAMILSRFFLNFEIQIEGQDGYIILSSPLIDLKEAPQNWLRPVGSSIRLPRGKNKQSRKKTRMKSSLVANHYLQSHMYQNSQKTLKDVNLGHGAKLQKTFSFKNFSLFFYKFKLISTQDYSRRC